ncbi:N-alpha-acetyl-L-2,4-diaminobutyric acid deacetylase [Anaerolineae bacterium]|nr:N-alpha-acetyl-L-2,4-diaminobutyric acid deacetylase [Anaerolineae bacterium]
MITTRYTTTQSSFRIGELLSKPGEYAYGKFHALQLPNGSEEFLPVIIAHGRSSGPVLWITAGIHGDEYTGIGVIHRLLTPELLTDLRGAVVSVPTLNPAGLRVGERAPYYLKKLDPNRLFPEPEDGHYAEDERPRLLEGAYARLFEEIKRTASVVVDLHNYSILSIPFAFRDPVYYRNETELTGARELHRQTNELLESFGFTIINEYASRSYLKRNLHRSVSGAAQLVAKIPAFTVELGGYLTIDPTIADAAAVGLRNLMRHMGMLPGDPEPLQGIPILSLDHPVRRMAAVIVPETGIVRFLIRPGMILNQGDPVALLSDIYGRPLGKEGGLLRVEESGIVIGLSQGAAFYEGDHLLSLAVRDDADPILKYPY